MSFVGVRFNPSNPVRLDSFPQSIDEHWNEKVVVSHLETFFSPRLYNYMDHKIKRFFFSVSFQIFLSLGITSHFTLPSTEIYCSLNFEIVEIERINRIRCNDSKLLLGPFCLSIFIVTINRYMWCGYVFIRCVCVCDDDAFKCNPIA